MRFATVFAITFLIASTSAQPEHGVPQQLSSIADELASGSWTAVIEAEVRTGEEPISVRKDRMAVWFELGGKTRLRFGQLYVEVSHGELTVFHGWNREAYYHIEKYNAPIAELIRAELPPLWCPWLAMALSQGDPTVSPVVGDARTSVRFEERTSFLGPCSGQACQYWYPGTLGKQPVHLVVTQIMTAPTPEGDDEAVRFRNARLTQYILRPVDGGNTEIVLRLSDIKAIDDPYFDKLDDSFTRWPGFMTQGRTLVDSIADLESLPPEIAVGDRFPAVSFARALGGNLSVELWRPLQRFNEPYYDPETDGAALVLAVTRPTDAAHEWVKSTAAAIIDARQRSAVDEKPIGVIARPVIATRTEEVVVERLIGFGESWAEVYTPHRPFERSEGRLDLTWLPASLLLDRVAPGADAAIVVVDRSGWITGVIGPELTGDDLADAIAEAVRSAAR